MFTNAEKKARRKRYYALRKIRLARDIASNGTSEFHKHPYKMSHILKHFYPYLNKPKASIHDIVYDIKLRMPGIIRRSKAKNKKK